MAQSSGIDSLPSMFPVFLGRGSTTFRRRDRFARQQCLPELPRYERSKADQRSDRSPRTSLFRVGDTPTKRNTELHRWCSSMISMNQILKLVRFGQRRICGSLRKRLVSDSFFLVRRLWMIGLNITPLDELISLATREETIQRIIREYPEIVFTKGRKFYRLRINPDQPEEFNQYDSPPVGRASYGRLDSENFPVMYASQDLQICIHECRVAAEDEIFVATLALTKDVRLLDLTAILPEPGRDEFESLDIAVHMLFFAKEHSYEVSRALALSAFKNGYDGLIYPSYFSLLKTGNFPFKTTFGMSHRNDPQARCSGKIQDHRQSGFVRTPDEPGCGKGSIHQQTGSEKSSLQLSFRSGWYLMKRDSFVWFSIAIQALR